MTGPDRRVLVALDRRSGLDVEALRRATRLALATLRVTLRKLQRMRLIAATAEDRFQLTAKGKRVVKTMRTAG